MLPMKLLSRRFWITRIPLRTFPNWLKGVGGFHFQPTRWSEILECDRATRRTGSTFLGIRYQEGNERTSAGDCAALLWVFW